MKTPEQMAEEYCDYKSKAYYIDQNGDQKWYMTERGRYSKEDFLAGYQAAMDTYQDAISTYEEVAKQMLEEAVRIMSPKDQLVDDVKIIAKRKIISLAEAKKLFPYSKDQLADAGKVMNSSNNSNGWISVKERLPELPEDRPYYGSSTCVLITVVAESDQETPVKPYVTVAHLMQFKSEEPSWIACACSVIGYCDELGEWKLEQVSHWMPLPTPPEE